MARYTTTVNEVYPEDCTADLESVELCGVETTLRVSFFYEGGVVEIEDCWLQVGDEKVHDSGEVMGQYEYTLDWLDIETQILQQMKYKQQSEDA